MMHLVARNKAVIKLNTEIIETISFESAAR